MSIKRSSGMLRRHGCCLSKASLKAGLRRGTPLRMPCFPLPFLRCGLASVCTSRTSDVCWNFAELRLCAVTPARLKRADSLASAPVGRAGRRPGSPCVLHLAAPASALACAHHARRPLPAATPRHATPRTVTPCGSPRSRSLARAARQQRAPSLPAQVAERPARARARAGCAASRCAQVRPFSACSCLLLFVCALRVGQYTHCGFSGYYSDWGTLLTIETIDCCNEHEDELVKCSTITNVSQRAQPVIDFYCTATKTTNMAPAPLARIRRGTAALARACGSEGALIKDRTRKDPISRPCTATHVMLVFSKAVDGVSLASSCTTRKQSP